MKFGDFLDRVVFLLARHSERTMKTNRHADFTLENHGSVFLLRPHSDGAHAWVEENIGQDNGFQPMWPTVVVEPRYISPIVEDIAADGLEIT
jgi:hypothetical protein